MEVLVSKLHFLPCAAPFGVTHADFSDNLNQPLNPMNQFRDILMCALIILAFGLLLGHPEDQNWTWATFFGGYVVSAIDWMSQARPWSIFILFALALALFMTRIKY